MSEANFNVNLPSSETDDDMNTSMGQKRNWLSLRMRLVLKQQEEARSMT